MILGLSQTAQAQQVSSSDKDTIIQVIQQFFDGMRQNDSAMVHHTLSPDILMFTTLTDKKGQPRMVANDAKKFLAAVGQPKNINETWDEKIWSYDVRIDGLLANAWTEYSFFYGGKLLHCGVNNFQLFKTARGWKIVNITDTRRKENCTTSADATINVLLDQWHKAAATADEDVFFGSMTADAVYIGTDASERWLRDEMKTWSAPFFELDTAWSFTPYDRHIAYSEDGKLAWFDELLDTWMGVCRASGVVVLTTEGWKIKHYHLSIAVPNEAVNDYLDILKKQPKSKSSDEENKE